MNLVRRAGIQLGFLKEAEAAASELSTVINHFVDAAVASSGAADMFAAEVTPSKPTSTAAERKEIWHSAKNRGVQRKQIAAKAFPANSSPTQGVDCFKKWLSAAAYPDGSAGDTAIRSAIAELLNKL